jgi:sec-independent protein translocase protein TatA
MLVTLSPLGLLPDFGGGEMMLILLVVLLLFGGDKMPQLAKSLGKSIREFKRAANEVEREIKRAIDEVPDTPDIRTTLREAAEQSRKKHSPRIAPKPVPSTDVAPPTATVETADSSPALAPDSPPSIVPPSNDGPPST